MSGSLVGACAAAVRRLHAATSPAATDSAIGLGIHQINRRFAAACAAAGLEGRRTTHSGRVGLAIELTVRGANAREVQLACGWRNAGVVPAEASTDARRRTDPDRAPGGRRAGVGAHGPRSPTPRGFTHSMIGSSAEGDRVATVQPAFRFTYEDYRTAPPDKRYELLNGNLVVINLDLGYPLNRSPVRGARSRTVVRWREGCPGE